MRVDLSSDYLGLHLASPLVASASPCTAQVDVLRQLEECGAGAAVLPSLFEEQVSDASHKAAFLSSYNSGARNYCRLVTEARAAVAMPIIASLNGVTPGGWLTLAKEIEESGADALELNLHDVPVDRFESAADLESRYLELVAQLRDQNDIPLAVKIGPCYSSLPNFAQKLTDVAADGLVLFNRFLEPNVNLEQRTIEPYLELSTPHEARLAMRWVGILRDQLPDISLAASGGFHNGIDVVKAIAVGADVVMVASALLRNGIEHLDCMRRDIVDWLSGQQFASIGVMRGSLCRGRYETPEVYERINYARTVASYIEQGARSF